MAHAILSASVREGRTRRSHRGGRERPRHDRRVCRKQNGAAATSTLVRCRTQSSLRKFSPIIIVLPVTVKIVGPVRLRACRSSL